MSVLHIVLLTLKDGTNAEDRSQLYKTFKDAMVQIPGVEGVDIGQSFGKPDLPYTDAFIVRMRDRNVLAEYASHEKHEEAAKALAPLIKGVLSMDIES